MIRVMVVDDSPLVRRIASDILSSDREITVAATASTAEIALQKLESEHPQVITMDLEMPGMGGLEAISQIMRRRPTPIILFSAFAQRGAELTLQALDRGAVDFIAKPNASLSGGIAAIATELIEKVKQAGRIDLGLLRRKQAEASPTPRPAPRWSEGGSQHAVRLPYDLVAIGTSTGGPVALRTVLQKLPEDFPIGIVVVQHMPPIFTKAFAERLDSLCEVSVKEAEDGDEILPGRVLIAPGDFHMTITQYHTGPKAVLSQWEPVNGHRPSVDVLMHSVAREYGERAIGVIMTGMGKDGAEGIRELKQKGGYVIAQDKDSSVIFGMNREVIKNRDADRVAGVTDIADGLLECLQRDEAPVEG